MTAASFVMATFSSTTAAAPADLCAGLAPAAYDKLSHPEPLSMARPTVGVPYTDPIFGSRITRITDVKADTGQPGITVPMYNSIPAWNIDETYMILYRSAGFAAGSTIPGHHLLYNGKTYQYIKQLNFSPADVEHVYWDPVDPKIFYYPTNVQQGAGYVGRINMYNVDTDQITVLWEMSPTDLPAPPINGVNDAGTYSSPTACAGGTSYSAVCNGRLDFDHPKYMQFNGKILFGVRYIYSASRSNGGNGYDGMTTGIVIDRTTKQVTVNGWKYITGAPEPDVGAGGANQTMQYGLAVAPTGSIGVWGPWVVDPMTLNKITRPDGTHILNTGWNGHDAMGPYGTTGQDVFIGPQYENSVLGNAAVGAVVAEIVQTGQVKVIVGPNTGWPYTPAATHASVVALKNPGWVAISMVGGNPGNGIMSDGVSALDQEIILANVVTNSVCRVAHHYSVRTSQGYWAEPHVVISPSGTRLLFGSDWRNSDSVDSYVVELPTYTP
jgi:hypothetical protein